MIPGQFIETCVCTLPPHSKVRIYKSSFHHYLFKTLPVHFRFTAGALKCEEHYSTQTLAGRILEPPAKDMSGSHAPPFSLLRKNK
jgi:hypothetical protein